MKRIGCRGITLVIFFGLLPVASSVSAGARKNQRTARGDPKTTVIEDARAELEACEPGPATAERRGHLNETIGDAERARNREKAARAAYNQALRAYASAGADRSRDALLKRLSRPGRGWSKKVAAAFAEIRIAWEQIRDLREETRRLPRLERPPESPELLLDELTKKVDAIREAARRYKDLELSAWSCAVSGRIAGASGDPQGEISLCREGAELCANGACPKIRRKLLSITAGLLEKHGELEQAFRLLATANAETSAGLPEERRRYARPKALFRVCRLLRAKPGAPSCRDLETKVAGFETFWDFSRQPEKETLGDAEIAEVHGEYLPLLSDCLLRAAREREVEPGKTLELDWTVRNDGRADRLGCAPPIDTLGVKTCFERALQVFRYPRYRGERRNVTLPLSVE